MDHAKNDKNQRKYKMSKKSIWYREQNHIRKERDMNKNKYVHKNEKAMNQYTYFYDYGGPIINQK
jgi:hypothetical protein